MARCHQRETFTANRMILGPFTGGCLCGAIRYEVDRVFDVIYCHCNQCRRSSGAPVLLTAQVSGDAFRLTKGSPSEYSNIRFRAQLFLRNVRRRAVRRICAAESSARERRSLFLRSRRNVRRSRRGSAADPPVRREQTRRGSNTIDRLPRRRRATLCRIRTSAETANDSDLMDRGPGAPRPERVRCR